MDIFGIIYKALNKLSKLVTGLRKDVDKKQNKLTYADGSEVTNYKDLKLNMLKGLPFRDTVLIVNDTKEDGHYVTVTTETSSREEIIVHSQDYTIYIKDPVKYFYSDWVGGDLYKYTSACLSLKTSEIRVKHFRDFKKLTYCGYIDTMDSSAVSLDDCFGNCKKLNYIPDYFIQVPITRMLETFYGCESLTKLPMLNTSSCDNFSSCCAGCGMYEIPSWEFGAALNMDNFASGANNITNVEIFIINALTANSMFSSCPNLTEALIYGYRLNSVKYLFNNDKNLKRALLNLSDATQTINLHSAFNNCSNLEEVNLWSFDNVYVTELGNTWYSCSKLTTLPDINVSQDDYNPTPISEAFNYTSLIKLPKLNGYVKFTNPYHDGIYCETLQEIPKYTVCSVAVPGGLVFRTPNLTTLGGFAGIDKSLDFKECPLLTRESVLNVFNNLTLTNATINLHKNTYTKLSEDDIAIAVSCGWTVQNAIN